MTPLNLITLYDGGKGIVATPQKIAHISGIFV